MAKLDQVKKTYTKFEQAIEEKDFVKACEIFKDIDSSLKAIGDFSALSSEELVWLNHLNQKITTNLPILRQESKELVAKIKPFNDNKSVKDLYSDK